MATTTATPPKNGFIGFLDKAGNDIKKVWAWLGTPKAQAVVNAGEGAGEAVVDAIDPGLAALNPLIANWTAEIFKAQAMSAAAGQTSGNGEQKSAVVLSTMTPQVTSFAETAGLPVPIGTSIQTANNALVAFLNALGGTPATPAS